MIKTEGIQYVGSKKKLVDHIINISNYYNIKTAIDGFSGTTRVSQAFKYNGNTVISNDISVYSKVFAQCYMLNKNKKSYYSDMIEHLNNLTPIYGWYSEHYGGDYNNGINLKSDKKMVWQIHNTMKLDAIRNEIDRIASNEIEKSVLLVSLINGLDPISNTMGHQVSYLKKWATKTNRILELKVPDFIVDDLNHKVYQKDIFDITEYADLAYLDPPYGTNNKKMPSTRVRYNSYYHLWTTICLNDNPNTVGLANRREDASSDKNGISVFENVNEDFVLKNTKKLIDTLNVKYIIFSYNNKGRMAIDNLISLFNSNTTKLINQFSFNHKENVMANSTITNEWLNEKDVKLQEFLFVIEKK